MSTVSTATVLLALVLVSQESAVYGRSEDDAGLKNEEYLLENSSCSNTWFFKHNYSTTCECGSSLGQKIECNSTTERVKLLHCFCMTTNGEEDGSEVVGGCIYSCVPGVYGSGVYYSLPRNRSQLNHWMCSRYNRDGQLCGECMDDTFAPPVYSYNVSCVECRKSNWLKFIAISFLPLTVFWFVVIVFGISATSGHLNAFIFISQILTSPQRNRSLQQAQAAVGWIKRALLGFVTLHGVWNLDFFRLLYSPFCLHPRMSTIQALALDYLIAVYPLLLIIVTYLFVELHDYYTIVSWLWRPFQKCFLSIKKEWNIRGSLINAFATFLLLSYVKFLMVSVDLLIPVRLYNVHGKIPGKLYLYFGEVEYFGKEHLPYAILAIGVLLIFNILPIVLLFLYTCRCFHKCLNRGRLNCQVLHIFMDAFQGCYKNGTEGTRDCRWFSTVYPLAQFVGLTVAAVIYTVPNLWLSAFIFIHLVLLLILAVAQPYKSSVHNTADSFLLFVSAILYVADVAANAASVGRYSELSQVLHTIAGFLFLVPLLYLIGLALYKLLAHRHLTRKTYQRIYELLPCNRKKTDFEESMPDRLVHPEDYEPLLMDPVS